MYRMLCCVLCVVFERCALSVMCYVLCVVGCVRYAKASGLCVLYDMFRFVCSAFEFVFGVMFLL